MFNLTYLERLVRDSLQAGGNDPDALPSAQPQSGVVLQEAPPTLSALWNAAVCDIESNLIETEAGDSFFAASRDAGTHLDSRTLSIMGVLGLNRIFPDHMYTAYQFARRARMDVGWKVCESEVIGDIWAPWETEALDYQGFIDKYDTDSFIQNTDDVFWIWAAQDLFERGIEAGPDEWKWLYDNGEAFFDKFYSYFYDEVDEMYCAQATGVAIHRPDMISEGYPKTWEVADCVHCHPTSTNALYIKAFEVMAEAARQSGHADNAAAWAELAPKLRESLAVDMCHDEGSLAYYRDRYGKLTSRRHALGEALAVMHGIVSKEDGKELLATYPYDKVGVPVIHPALSDGKEQYDQLSWPWVSTFFFMAREQVRGMPEVNANAVAVARCFHEGSFHEKMKYRAGDVLGSPQSSCSAAAWINVCLRAGLVPVSST